MNKKELLNWKINSILTDKVEEMIENDEDSCDLDSEILDLIKEWGECT